MKHSGFVVGDRILGLAADSHPDWCAAYGRLGAYTFIGASSIGKMHLRNQRPRDDAFAIRSAGPWLAVAVADGAGSRPYARYGASYAVEALCEQLLRETLGISAPVETTEKLSAEANESDGGAISDLEVSAKPTRRPLYNFPWRWSLSRQGNPTQPVFDPSASEFQEPLKFEIPYFTQPTQNNCASYGTLCWYQDKETESDSSEFITDREICLSEAIVSRAFQLTRAGLEQFALSRGLSLRDVHCTLLGMILNTRTGAVAAGHIGDGLIAMLHPGLGAHPLVDPPKPSTVGETYMFTQREWQNYFVTRSLTPDEAAGGTTFYLMTDGVADDCTHPPPENIFQQWARDVDRELRKDEAPSQTATRLLNWLASYEARGSWDDRTLVVILRNRTRPYECSPAS